MEGRNKVFSDVEDDTLDDGTLGDESPHCLANEFEYVDVSQPLQPGFPLSTPSSTTSATTFTSGLLSQGSAFTTFRPLAQHPPIPSPPPPQSDPQCTLAALKLGTREILQLIGKSDFIGAKMYLLANPFLLNSFSGKPIYAILIPDSPQLVLYQLDYYDWSHIMRGLLHTYDEPLLMHLFERNPIYKDRFLGFQITALTSSGTTDMSEPYEMCAMNFSFILGSKLQELIALMWNGNYRLHTLMRYFNSSSKIAHQTTAQQLLIEVLNSHPLSQSDFIQQYVASITNTHLLFSALNYITHPQYTNAHPLTNRNHQIDMIQNRLQELRELFQVHPYLPPLETNDATLPQHVLPPRKRQ